MTATPQRLLVITPYAPYRDGIAAYALQQVRSLRAAGHTVEVLSREASAAHHHLDFFELRELPRLVTLARGFDRVIVHFHPAFFFPQPITLGVRLRYFTALGMTLRRCPPVTMVLHEINRDWGLAGGVSHASARFLLNSFSTIEVHDSLQRDELSSVFGLDTASISVVRHGAHFYSRTARDRPAARHHLGIAEDEFVFLCIGFVAEHKGFDRALDAFRRLGAKGEHARVRLDITGSPSPGSPAAEAYHRELREEVEATPGAHLHGGYVSDARFDEWLLAADAVLLPYRLIWSSSVLERAAMFGCTIVATTVGGLPERLAEIPGAHLVHDDVELGSAMAAVLDDAGITVTVAELDEPWGVAPDAVAEEVRRRAAERRGHAFRDPTSPSAQAPGSSRRTPDRATAALRRIGPLARPIPVSGRPGVSTLKRLERRLWDWELAPLIGWVDEIRRATLRAVEGQAVRGDLDEGDAGVERSPTRR